MVGGEGWYRNVWPLFPMCILTCLAFPSISRGVVGEIRAALRRRARVADMPRDMPCLGHTHPMNIQPYYYYHTLRTLWRPVCRCSCLLSARGLRPSASLICPPPQSSPHTPVSRATFLTSKVMLLPLQ